MKTLAIFILFTLVVLLVTWAFIAGWRRSEERRSEDPRVEYTTDKGKKTSDITSIKNGTVKYEVIDKGTIPEKAKQLHAEARTKGEAGDYIGALKLLTQAITLAPDWAYPHYDMAFTYLIQGNSGRALEKYKDADRLAPEGFFTTKTAIWSLEREEQGLIPSNTYIEYVSLEWAEEEKKRAILDRMLTNAPAFAPAWKAKALLTESPEQRLGYLERALALEPDEDTRGMCLLNKAAVLNGFGNSAEAQKIATELANSPTSTTNNKVLAKEFLKSLKP